GEDAGESQDESDNSVSESLDDCDDSLAEISRSFRSQQEICEQLNINHMIQRIFLLTLDNSDPTMKSGNGIPLRCVYLEELASELDGQDWLDMDNVEQVPGLGEGVCLCVCVWRSWCLSWMDRTGWTWIT
ncbi:hypothetical protein FKM82_029481, partial [Ascaphus truei]